MVKSFYWATLNQWYLIYNQYYRTGQVSLQLMLLWTKVTPVSFFIHLASSESRHRNLHSYRQICLRIYYLDFNAFNTPTPREKHLNHLCVHRRKPAQGRHNHVILYSFNTESPSSSFSQTRVCVRVSEYQRTGKDTSLTQLSIVRLCGGNWRHFYNIDTKC